MQVKLGFLWVVRIYIFRMRDGVWKEKYLVDVKTLEGTNQIQFDLAEGLTIGAAINMNRVDCFTRCE
jgi:CO/xanthine dehydrogenase FAD-binding subunit